MAVSRMSVSRSAVLPTATLAAPAPAAPAPAAVPISIRNFSSPVGRTIGQVYNSPIPKVTGPVKIGDGVAKPQPGPTPVSAASQATAAKDAGTTPIADEEYVDPGQIPYEEEVPQDGDGNESYEPTYDEASAVAGDVPFASAHISNGSLNTIGFAKTSFGWEPVVSSIYMFAPKTERHIPVSFGEDSPSPTLNAARYKSANVLRSKANSNQQREAARALVKRARAGDQIAMAMLSQTKKKADAGSPVAAAALMHVKEYIHANPTNGSFGNELSVSSRTDPNFWGSIWLANGPLLSDEMLRAFASNFSGEETAAFMFGFKHHGSQLDLDSAHHGLDEDQRKVLDIGRMFGEARALQYVRMPGARISEYQPVVGWELGE